MTTRTRKLTKSRVNKRHSEASLRLVRGGARAASLETADRVSRRREKKRATSRISRLATNGVREKERAGRLSLLIGGTSEGDRKKRFKTRAIRNQSGYCEPTARASGACDTT